MNPFTLGFGRSNLTRREREGLDELRRSKILDQVLADADRERVAARKVLVDERPGVERALQAAMRAADVACALLIAKADAAERALVNARVELSAGRAAAAAPITKAENRLAEIDAKLLADADPRLAEYGGHLDELASRARVMVETWLIEAAPKSFWEAGDDGPRYATNLAAVEAARTALAEAAAECQRLRRAAIDRLAITEALIRLNEGLAAPLTPLELNPPRIDRDGEIGEPLPWSGAPRWSVEDLLEPGALRKTQLEARDAAEKAASAPRGRKVIDTRSF